MNLQTILNGTKGAASAVGKAIDYAAKRPKISLPVVGALTAYVGSIAIPGETVFEGRIGDSQVVYMEGVTNLNPFSRGNVMIAKKNGVKYTLVDSTDRTGIDWKSDSPRDFQRDHLEYVTIDGRDRDYDFSSKHIGNGTIEGKEAQDVFAKADSWYNKMRGAIRTELRDKYTSGLANLKKNLD